MVIMETIFIIMFFCMGAVFGSFFTLAVYRIPLKLNITHERSFCPNCNHRLEFLDLIPIFSYLFLKGKCRYCGKPVRIRYLLLEVLSGLVFVAAYFSLHLNFPFFEISSIALMIAFVMFYITNAIILGIDKEYIKIEKSVLLFGIISQSIYMLYLFSAEKSLILFYVICLIIMLLLFCLETYILKKITNSSDIIYIISILELIIYEIMFIQNWKTALLMIILSVVIYIIYAISRIFYKRKKEENILDIIKLNKIPIGFCISLSSILSYLISNFYL